MSECIVFRADASIGIGAGHIARCLTLADILAERGAEIHFVCRAHEGHLGRAVSNRGYRLHLFPAEHSSGASAGNQDYREWLGATPQRDQQATQSVLRTLGKPVSWLIVDHYGIDNDWLLPLRQQVEKVLVIDDLANRSQSCDLLLDQTYGRDISAYRAWVSSECHFMLGSEYALLRPQFSGFRDEALARRQSFQKIDSLLIAMGGTDPLNLTAEVIAAVESFPWIAEPEVDVVLGAAAPHVKELKRYASASPFSIRIHHDIDDMARLMTNADVCIGAGGGSCWERCCLGLPSILIQTADNQAGVISALSARGAALVPERSAPLQERLNEALSELSIPELYRKVASSAASVADGLGARRVRQEMFPLQSRDGRRVSLRPVNQTDGEILYEWQSHPETRRYFRNSQIPALDEHLDWFQRSLESSSRELYMVFYSLKPAGVIRLDRLNDDSAVFEVSILVAPGFYRKGLARVGLSLVRDLWPEREFVAEVDAENKASEALFRSAGYRLENGMYISCPDE